MCDSVFFLCLNGTIFRTFIYGSVDHVHNIMDMIKNFNAEYAML